MFKLNKTTDSFATRRWYMHWHCSSHAKDAFNISLKNMFVIHFINFKTKYQKEENWSIAFKLR